MNNLDERMKALAQSALDKKISIWELLAEQDAELAAKDDEIERLRGIIRGTEWVLSADEYDPSKETIVVQYECAICHFVYLDSPGEHAEYCPFYQWEAK